MPCIHLPGMYFGFPWLHSLSKTLGHTCSCMSACLDATSLDAQTKRASHVSTNWNDIKQLHGIRHPLDPLAFHLLEDNDLQIYGVRLASWV